MKSRTTILLPEYALDERLRSAAQAFLGHDSIAVTELSHYAQNEQWYIQKIKEKKKYSILPEDQIIQIVQDPLVQAALLLGHGAVDGVVVGAYYTTAEVIRAGLHIIGCAKDMKTVSSSMLLTLTTEEKLIFSDCAVITTPTAEQLADIAISSVATARSCEIEEPRVAFLSYSTYGSAQDASIDTIHDTMEILKDHPNCNFPFDGEVQFDTAFIPSIAKAKSPESIFATERANIFIFPNLHAANIAYKITERLAGAQATGPLLQGFSRPFNDLSRGCSVEDIEAMITYTAKQAH